MRFEELYRKIMRAKTSDDVEKILKQLGDTGTIVDLSRPLSSGYQWIPYGDNVANAGLIELGSSPGNALAERTTNSFDASIEAALVEQGIDPRQFSGPFEATAALFGRGDGGDGDEWVAGAPSVWVVLGPEEEPDKRGRVDVLDVGSGVSVEEFRKTLVSLHAQNKVAKPWLVGTFGQGASVTLSFSRYVLLASKKLGDDRIAFTICRKAGIADFKVPCYLYLVDKDGKIPFVEAREVDFYPEYGSLKTSIPDKIKNGTLCRHFGFSLSGIRRLFFGTRESLWDTMNVLLFDAMLPIRCVDLREEGVVKKERALGSRRRLQKLASKSEDDAHGNVSMRYRRDPFLIKPKGFENAVKVELWVPYATKASKNGPRRRSSTEVYIRANHPIVFTNNGQCHGMLSPEILVEAGLHLVRKNIIINIDCSALNGHERGLLLSSDREKIKDGDALDFIKETLREDLEADETLAEIEVELEDEILGGVSESDEDTTRELSRWAGDDEEIKKKLGEVLKGWVIVPPRPKRRTKKLKRESKTHLPLATLPFPQVTALQVTSPTKDGYKHYVYRHSMLRVETNADDRFWAEGLVSIRSVPEGLIEVRAKYPLSGGRMGWMLDLNYEMAAARIGKPFVVIVEVFSPDGKVLISATRQCVVEASLDEKNKQDLMIGVKLIGCDDENETAWEEVFGDRDPNTAFVEARMKNAGEGKKELVVYLNKSHERLNSIVSKMPSEQRRDTFLRKFKLFGGMMGVRQYLYRKDVNVMDETTDRECKRFHDFVTSDPAIEMTLRNVEAEEKAMVASR